MKAELAALISSALEQPRSAKRGARRAKIRMTANDVDVG